MANDPRARARRKPRTNPKRGQRQVLERQTVIVLPAGVDLATLTSDGHEKELKKLLGAPVQEAWVEAAIHEGSESAAIEAYAGRPGTAEAKPGAYKAVPLASWDGGEVYEAPPAPLVVRRRLGA